MAIDKSWIKLRNRRSPEFLKGLKNFIEIAKNHVDEEGKVCCPCRDCVNMYRHVVTTIYAHIHDRGFQQSYQTWTYHGEEYPASDLDNFWAPRSHTTATDEMFDAIDDVMAEQDTNEENINEEGTGLDTEFDALFEEVNTELFPGCTWLSSLNFLAKMMHIKVINKWTDGSFDQTLELLRFAFPKGNKLPPSHYEAKKTLRKIGLGYESIHACINDCALFWKENVSMQNCPVCNESRWVDKNTKGKKVPQKVLRYFPLTSRLRRRYSSRFMAKDMVWHKTGRSEDGMMRHPVDGKAWQEFDKRYPEFSKEPRNVRLGLAADGFNPFSNMSKPYSMWPVVLTTYNTPPWLCMKESSFMLTLLIPGPRSPAKDIDVFLRPLVEELKVLWAQGVQMRDAATNTIFTMRAALLWTINDYPARSSLSGWSGQGYKACATCNKDTPSCRVTNKIAYVGHRRFLHSKHKWRDSLLFNGEKESRKPPRRFSNAAILKQLNCLRNCIPGKHASHGGVKRKRVDLELNWTKRSIFFELDYWSSLELKHNLDVMHVEKNVCESLLGTLLMNEKSKDTPKAREDLENWGIREDLWLQKKNNKIDQPHPPYSFKPIDRERFCQFCSMYFEGMQTKFNCPDRNVDAGIPKRQFSVFSSQCRPMSKKNIIALSEEANKALQWFVLYNCDELKGYISEFQSKKPGRDVKEGFSSWFDDKVYCLQKEMSPECTDELKALAHGPLNAFSYTACIVNGVRFVVHSRDLRRTTQNSGVVSYGEDGTLFYGQLEDIIQLNYLSGYSVVLFRCKWFNTSGKGRLIKKNNIVAIDISREWYIGNAWYDGQQYILATQAKQVFYLQDPSRNANKWRVVEDVHHRKLWDHPSINIVNDLDVLHNAQSSDYNLAVNVGDVGEASVVVERCVAPIVDQSFHCNLVVDLGYLPMQATCGEVGESSEAPINEEDESFIDDDDEEDSDAYPSEDEIIYDKDDSDDDHVETYCSSDDSD